MSELKEYKLTAQTIVSRIEKGLGKIAQYQDPQATSEEGKPLSKDQREELLLSGWSILQHSLALAQKNPGNVVSLTVRNLLSHAQNVCSPELQEEVIRVETKNLKKINPLLSGSSNE